MDVLQASLHRSTSLDNSAEAYGGGAAGRYETRRTNCVHALLCNDPTAVVGSYRGLRFPWVTVAYFLFGVLGGQ